jgi:hypothetical protein
MTIGVCLMDKMQKAITDMLTRVMNDKDCENSDKFNYDLDNSVRLKITDSDSNTPIPDISVVTGRCICQAVFISLLLIYDKYSNHKSKNPSFKDFTVSIERKDGEITGVNVKFQEPSEKPHTFKITFTELPEEVKKQDIEIVMDDEILYTIKYGNFDFDGNGNLMDPETVCELKEIMIPYTLIDSYQMESVLNEANKESYKDRHDTIIGYNMFVSKVRVGKAVCQKEDVCKDSRLIGYDLAYYKALSKKISSDIIEAKAFADCQMDIANRYLQSATKYNRIARRCSKSYKRVNRIINSFRK